MWTRIKHAFESLKWKVFCPPYLHTCYYIQRELDEESKKAYDGLMLRLYGFRGSYSLRSLWIHGEIYVHFSDARRDLMWRFLIKGER
jgi:hypothetical protein